MYQTTEKDFKRYKKHVKRYIKKFGLVNWELTFKHEDLLEIEGVMAGVSYHLTGRAACFYLTKSWPEMTTATKEDIKKSAYHEVLELLLTPLREHCCDMNISPVMRHQAAEELAHDIIRTFENAEFGL